ncbi:MAG TPA: fatty acid desaturase [Kofleriaceae bacterium]|jgi:fatty acid desaturase
MGERALLRHSEDLRAFGFAAVHIGLVVGTLVAFRHCGWVVAAITVPLLACSAFVQLITTHNTMHTPLFYSKRLNRIWQCALSTCIGYPVSVYVPVHNLSHHLGLQTPRDVLRTTEVRHRWNLVNLVHHMVMGTVHVHLLHVAYLFEMRKSRPKWFAQVRWELLTVLAYFTAIGLFAGPLAAVLLVLAPNIAGQMLMVGFGYVQHDGCDHESEYNHSRNFLSPIFNWFIFDNGFHTGHHNKAAMHWSKGRAAHYADVVPHMDPRLDEPSLIRYMWRAFGWPAKRLNFDGTPVVIVADRQRRELWTPASAIATGASSGAVEG